MICKLGLNQKNILSGIFLFLISVLSVEVAATNWTFWSKNRCENLLKSSPFAAPNDLRAILWSEVNKWEIKKTQSAISQWVSSFGQSSEDPYKNRSALFLKKLDEVRSKTYRTFGPTQKNPEAFYITRKNPDQMAKLEGVFPDLKLLDLEMKHLFDSRLRDNESFVVLYAQESVNPFDDLSLLIRPDLVISTKTYELLNRQSFYKQRVDYKVDRVGPWSWSELQSQTPLLWKINEGIEYLPTHAVWIFYEYEFANIEGAPMNFGYGDHHGIVASSIDFAQNPPLRYRKIAVRVKMKYESDHNSWVLKTKLKFDNKEFYYPSSLVNYTELIYSDWQDLPN
jgi:hypothetical protein